MTAIDYRTATVLITGASAGIGTEFARRLAERGADVILVARRQDRLENLAAELRAAHGVTAVPIALDLTAPAAGERLRAAVAQRGLVVTSVINNAGFGTEGPFADEDPERLRAEIAVNVAAVVDIARAFIGDLRSRGGGFLINVASMAAYVPSPRMAVYAATKAFVLSFTEALWYEHRGTGVKVFALSPGATETEFFAVLGNDGADGGLGRQTAGEVVDAALRALDTGGREPSVLTSGRNRASVGLLRLLSRRRALAMMGRITARAA